MPETDLIVVGAGPAGMLAARTAADAGLAVLLLDEQARAGGQIYRNVERAALVRSEVLGKDFSAGLRPVEGLGHAGITHLKRVVVWQVENGRSVYCSVDGTATVCSARRILLATGAIERSMPVPGWTLPGVMTAGAAQILLKQSGIVCERAVLVGTGPLLYLVAAQMVRAGSPPLALIETQTMRDLVSAQRHVLGAMLGWRYLAKGLGLLAEIVRARVPRYTGATDVRIEGSEGVRSVRFHSGGRDRVVECDTALLHHGVVPNTQIARSIGVEHRWSEAQQCFVPSVDEWGRTGVDDVRVVGDGAGIGGAVAAALAGELAALDIARELGGIPPDERDARAGALRRRRARDLAVRPFIDRAYPPFPEALVPADGTVVCRCEEVTAGDIRRYAELGCLGPNQTKAFGRSGMGPCQGRYCGLSVTTLLADANGQTPDATGYYRIRPPIKPVTLAELATLETASDD